MDNAIVYEADDSNRDEVLTGFMIGGPNLFNSPHLCPDSGNLSKIGLKSNQTK